MYIDVSYIIYLININISDEVVCAIGYNKEVDAEFVCIVLIVYPHTKESAACWCADLVKFSCWN